jgi:hypothetical protein
MARFRVSHRRPGYNDFLFGSPNFEGKKLKRNYIWGYANKKG